MYHPIRNGHFHNLTIIIAVIPPFRIVPFLLPPARALILFQRKILEGNPEIQIAFGIYSSKFLTALFAQFLIMGGLSHPQNGPCPFT
jgi:hypothetical protein